MKKMFHNTIRQDILRILFINLSKRIDKDEEPRDFVDAVDKSIEDDELLRGFIREVLKETFCTWCKFLFPASLICSDPLVVILGDIALLTSIGGNKLEAKTSDLLLTAELIV